MSELFYLSLTAVLVVGFAFYQQHNTKVINHYQLAEAAWVEATIELLVVTNNTLRAVPIMEPDRRLDAISKAKTQFLIITPVFKNTHVVQNLAVPAQRELANLLNEYDANLAKAKAS